MSVRQELLSILDRDGAAPRGAQEGVSNRNQSLGKSLAIAILGGRAEVVTPLTVATLAICIVCFPIFLLNRAARYLFIPQGMTVVCAMLAS